MKTEKRLASEPDFGSDAEAADRAAADSRLQASLRKYCLALTESAWDAEDLVQDAWLKAVQGKALAVHPNPEAFLLRIAKNAWIDRARRQAKYRRILKAERFPLSSAEEETYGLETIFHALTVRLPPLQRAVFLSRDALGYSGAETAKLLRTTEGAVKAALHRARQNIRRVKEDLLNGELPAPEDDELKAYLRAIAGAYAKGDQASLLELAQRIEIEPASALVAIRAGRRLAAPSARHAETERAGFPVLSLASAAA